MYKVSVIGFGYWGPNIVRNFSNHSGYEVNYIYDLYSNAQKRAEKFHHRHSKKSVQFSARPVVSFPVYI